MKWSARDYHRNADQLLGFLEPVIGKLGRIERRTAAVRYVHGLLMPGWRKSIEPMAQRLGVDAQSLQQFVSDSPFHLVLSALAYLFILAVHQRAQKNAWCDLGADAASDPALDRESHRLLLLLRTEV